MKSCNRTKLPGGFSPAILLLLGALLTAAILLGIKFLISEDSNGSLPQPSEQGDIFKQEQTGAGGAGLLPAARSESTSGGSLDIFQKANEGYSEDGSSVAAVTRPAGQGTVKTPLAAVPVKKQVSKKLQQRTVIPRIQGVKAFGTAAPDKQGMPKGGPGIPDMSEILKQARQKQGGGD